MAITLGTPTHSGNQTGVTNYTVYHTNPANTKTMVIMVTVYDTSDTDSDATLWICESAYYSTRRYRNGSAAIMFFYYELPMIGVAMPIRVGHYGSCTDSQVTVVSLISSTAHRILYDSYAEGSNVGTSHSLIVNPAKANSRVLGAIIDVQSAVTALSVTSGYGTEISGSEVDLGSQVVGCASNTASGTTAEIRWTKSASATSYALIMSFYEVFPPAIALNYPDNNATGIALTPALLFTGTDAESNLIEYHFQIDTVNTFDSGSTSDVVIYDSLIVSGSSSAFYASGWGQSFLTGSSAYKITSARGLLSQNGLPTGPIYAEIWSHQEIFGALGIPAVLLATSDSVETSTMISPVTFTFSGAQQVILQPYTAYFTIFRYPGGSQANSIWMNTSSGRGGNGAHGDYLYWGTSGDNNAEPRGTKYTPMINALSSLGNAGFLDVTNNADTHPFAAGDQLSYTVQSSLTSATDYYWRVIAIDSNGYATISETRKFTTSAGVWTTKSLKAYIGGSWVAKPLQAYIGGTWTTKPVKKIG